MATMNEAASKFLANKRIAVTGVHRLPPHRRVCAGTAAQLGHSGVDSRRFTGHAPDGRLEDFHAVRIVYRATCHEPTEPVVHDVGGTTESAAWVPVGDVGALPLTAGWRAALALWPPHGHDGAGHG